MMEILKQIEQLKLLPVIKLDASENAAPLAEALIEGGLPAAEVTFRTDARGFYKNYDPEISRDACRRRYHYIRITS